MALIIQIYRDEFKKNPYDYNLGTTFGRCLQEAGKNKEASKVFREIYDKTCQAIKDAEIFDDTLVSINTAAIGYIHELERLMNP